MITLSSVILNVHQKVWNEILYVICKLQMVVNVMTMVFVPLRLIHQQDHYFYMINETGEKSVILIHFL